MFTLFALNAKGQAALKNNLYKFEDLPKVLNSAKFDFDTIYIKSGKYTDMNLVIKNNKPLVILAEEKGGVVVTGKSQIIFRNCNDIEFSGFHFSNTQSSQLIKVERSSKVYIVDNYFEQTKGTRYSVVIGFQKQSSNNKVLNNSFDNLETMGITIRDDGSRNNIIHNNKFMNIRAVKDLYPESDGNGMESIQIGRWNKETLDHNVNAVISNNEFINVHGDGNEVVSVKSNSNIIKNNVFINCLGAITLRFGNSNKLIDNYFFNTSVPIRVFGTEQIIQGNYIENASIGIVLPAANYPNSEKKFAGYMQSKDVLISNNVFVGSVKQDILIGNQYAKGSRDRMPQSIQIKNNSLTKSLSLNREFTMKNEVELSNNNVEGRYSPTFSKKYKSVGGVSWR